MRGKDSLLMWVAGVLALGLWLVVPTAYAVTVTPLKFLGNQGREVVCDAAGGLGGAGGSTHVEVGCWQWVEVESDNWVVGGYQIVALADAAGEWVVYGEDEIFSYSDYLWILSTSRTYAIENWSWYSMDSEGTSHGYGEFQITSDTPWQIDIEFLGEKYAGSSLSMNAGIYDSAWNLLQNLERSFSWDDTWSGPDYDSAVFPSGAYYLTLDVQTQTEISVSGPPEPGEEPSRVESYAKGQIIADIKEAPPGETPKFLTLPYNDPDVRIQQGWVYTWNPDPDAHKGIDYIKGSIDQSSSWECFDVVACADGVAMQSSSNTYGNYVFIRHNEKDRNGNTYFTLYAHLNSVASGIPLKDKYDTDYSSWKSVKRGEPIGRAGNTGATWTGIHLHFEVQRKGYVQYKTDPYDLYTTRGSYPHAGPGCRPNHLWTTDPPIIADTIVAKLHSPAELRVYDPQGRITGLEDGQEKNEIPYSTYFENTVTIFVPADTYSYEVGGTGQGTYGLHISSVQGGEPTTFEAVGVPTYPGAVHDYLIDWDALSQGEKGVVLKVDAEGDGSFEQTIPAGAVLENPQISVNNLVNISTTRAAYDRRTGQFSVDVKVTNNSQKVIGSPVWLVIESISNPAVTLAGSDGMTIDGKPYVDLSGLLGNGQLDPGESISKRIYFNNPNRVQFTFKAGVRGVILP